jgi:hypothetical protein
MTITNNTLKLAIYIIGIVFLIYVDIILNRELRKKYSKKDTSYPSGRAFFIPLILPKKYFRKDKLWIAWFVYLISFIVLFILIYLFIKLINAI